MKKPKTTKSSNRIEVKFRYRVVFNKIKQTRIFWRGRSDKVEEIPNLFVRQLAKTAIRKRQNQTKGIWTVSIK